MSDVPAYGKFTRFDLTYQLTNYPQNTGISEERVKDAIAKAFAKWQTASRFVFRPITSATGTPDITLTFGSTSNAVGEDRFAHTDWVGHTITFNNTLAWFDYTECDSWTGAVTKSDLLSIATHEIGHILGLTDNDNSGSIMLRYTDCDRMKYMHDAPIPQVDITNLEQVYLNLYYDQNTIKWYKKGVDRFKFRNVVAAADGTVFGIDTKGNLCDFRPNEEGRRESVWNVIGAGITRVAVSKFSQLVLAIFGPYPLGDGDLKRYDAQGRRWIDVSPGSLGSGTKFTHIAVNSAGYVWAHAMLKDKDGRLFEQVVRYEGDIALGGGDWKTAPIVPWTDGGRSPDIAVGRRSSGGPLVWGSAPVSYYAANAQFAEWNEQQEAWGRAPKFFHVESSLGDGTVGNPIRPGPEMDRYQLVGKCVSIGDDGTVVGVGIDTAYRLDGTTWTPLPGQVIDVSVVTRTNMWAVDRDKDICSTDPFA
jgi:hypothetical protein